MEKKLIIMIALVIFGVVEVVISILSVFFVIPQMEKLDILLSNNFFNSMLSYAFFSAAIFIGLVQIIWGVAEHRKKKHHFPPHLLFFGITFSIIMLGAIYFLLVFPLNKMVSAS